VKFPLVLEKTLLSFSSRHNKKDGQLLRLFRQSLLTFKNCMVKFPLVLHSTDSDWIKSQLQL
jgi:hypothetical protein